MFSVFYGQGVLDSLEYRDTMALQFAESVLALCPQCDLVLLKNVDPQVLYSLGSEFTVCETKFGCVATKGTLSHCTENQNNLCRFNVDNRFTVTFASYDSLFALDRDLPVLCQRPFLSAHLICIVIQRTVNTVNWKTMVYKCSRALQIQYPQYPASHCSSQDDIVLLGWQRYTPCPLMSFQFYKALPLIVPLIQCPHNSNITTFNSLPVYVASYMLSKKHTFVQKRYKKTLHSHVQYQPLDPLYESFQGPCLQEQSHAATAQCTATVEQEQKQQEPPSPPPPEHLQPLPPLEHLPLSTTPPTLQSCSPQQPQDTPIAEEVDDWVLTAVYIEE